MESFIMRNLFPIVLSCVLSLVLYIYAQQNKRLTEVENICRMCPIHSMASVVAEIRTDLKWIKEKLNKI